MFQHIHTSSLELELVEWYIGTSVHNIQGRRFVYQKTQESRLESFNSNYYKHYIISYDLQKPNNMFISDYFLISDQIFQRLKLLNMQNSSNSKLLVSINGQIPSNSDKVWIFSFITQLSQTKAVSPNHYWKSSFSHDRIYMNIARPGLDECND